jgi:hypothetical protein
MNSWPSCDRYGFIFLVVWRGLIAGAAMGGDGSFGGR